MADEEEQLIYDDDDYQDAGIDDAYVGEEPVAASGKGMPHGVVCTLDAATPGCFRAWQPPIRPCRTANWCPVAWRAVGAGAAPEVSGPAEGASAREGPENSAAGAPATASTSGRKATSGKVRPLWLYP